MKITQMRNQGDDVANHTAARRELCGYLNKKKMPLSSERCWGWELWFENRSTGLKGCFLVYSHPTLLPSGYFFLRRFPGFLVGSELLWKPVLCAPQCSFRLPVAGSSPMLWLSEGLVCLTCLSTWVGGAYRLLREMGFLWVPQPISNTKVDILHPTSLAGGSGHTGVASSPGSWDRGVQVFGSSVYQLR